MRNSTKRELNAFADKVFDWADQNKSALLTTGTIGGYLGGMLLSNIHTAKVTRAIDSNPEMDAKTKLKLYSGYIPSAILTGGATICSIKEHKNYIADVGALTMTALSYKTELKALKESLQKNMSKSKAEDVETQANEEIVKRTCRVGDWEPCKPGEIHVYNAFDGRKFNITVNKLEAILNKINKVCNSDCYCEYNHFYYLQNLDQSAVGDALGWNAEWGEVWYKFTTHEIDPDSGEAVLYLMFTRKPRSDYKHPRSTWDED